MKNKLQPEHTMDNATLAMLTNLCLALTESLRIINAPPERLRQLESGDVAELYFWLKEQNVAAMPNVSNSATGDRGASPAKADGKA
jgi:hypothetical protein